MRGLLVYCRAGFEGEAGRELREAAARRGVEGDVVASPGSGFALFEAREPAGASRLWAEMGIADLVFARQLLGWVGVLDGNPEVAPERLLREALGMATGPSVGAVLAEAPDTEGGKALWPRCRRLTAVLETALAAEAGGGRGRDRLHLVFADPDRILVGVSDPARSSPWPLGIPRLRLPRAAPSRSALKLEEALLTFLDSRERERRLRAGMRAVDLGAAPGGWTWQLVRRGLVVTAVDNGPLDPQLVASGLVEHVRADGFAYRPPRPVDWLVCDMVTAPARVARLVGVWGSRGLCREAIFNLKLPSGGRLAQVRRAAGIVERDLTRAGARYTLRFRHLYHDREEVTGHLRLEAAPGPGSSARRTGGRAASSRRPTGGRPGRPRRRR